MIYRKEELYTDINNMENKIKKVQSVNFKVDNKKTKIEPKKTKQQKQPKQIQEPKIYTVLYYSDIIQLLINYKIPVAQQTLDYLKQNTAYLIPRELEIIKKRD